ncbi:50S ribosomal protein L25 [Actinomycetota bacterium]|nr:50S ribosomal protein L25 [Actinomycetota bacterium]
MADYSFDAPVRTDFGKGFARRTRAAGFVPSVVYSKGGAALHITLPTHDVTQAVRLPNALFELTIEGKKHNALVKNIQRDFVTRDIEHIDLLEVALDQVVTVPVELKVEGEVKPGNRAVTAIKTILVQAPAGSIPRKVLLNIEGSEAGAHFTVGDVVYPDGVTPAQDVARIITAVKELAKKKEAQVDVAGGGEEAAAAETPTE